MLVERPKNLGSRVSERDTAVAGTEQMHAQARHLGRCKKVLPTVGKGLSLKLLFLGNTCIGLSRGLSLS